MPNAWNFFTFKFIVSSIKNLFFFFRLNFLNKHFYACLNLISIFLTYIYSNCCFWTPFKHKQLHRKKKEKKRKLTRTAWQEQQNYAVTKIDLSSFFSSAGHANSFLLYFLVFLKFFLTLWKVSLHVVFFLPWNLRLHFIVIFFYSLLDIIFLKFYLQWMINNL